MIARRIFSFLLLLSVMVAPLAAFGQAPPAIANLPDQERRTAYSITANTCVCSVGFALFGSGTDVDSWIQVWVNGARVLSTDAIFGWSLSSATGSLSTIPRPITDAVLTFNAVQTATVQIVGAERPRQLSQFTEGRGVAARDLNQRFTDVQAVERELWDKTNDLTGRGLFFAPGNTTGPMPLPSACANEFLGFDASGLNPICLQPATLTPPVFTIGQGLNYAGNILSIGSGTDGNILNAQTGNYSIGVSDCSKTIFATGGQNTITLPVVAGFPGGCSVLIKNGDAANGKILSGFPSDLGAILYPLQSLGVKIVNGAWKSFYAPAPWAPTSAVTLFVSASGNDANDGLTSGTPITFATACLRRQTIFQPSSVSIQLADGTYSTAVQGALCSIEGNSGGNSQTLTLIVGDCVTPSNVVLSIPDGDTGIFVKDLGETEISCVKFQGAGSGVVVGISAAQFSVADLVSTVWGSFGNGSIFLNISQSSSLNLIGTAAMTLNGAPGGAGTVIALSSSANMLANSATTIAIPSALVWGGQFLQIYGPSMANIAGMTFTGSGVAGTTGKRASLIGNAFLATGAIACNTFFPGNGACTLVQGAQDDANDPSTSPIYQAQFTIGGLPTCNSAVQGTLAYVTNGVASPTYRASVSTTGSALQLVGCDGSGWTYH